MKEFYTIHSAEPLEVPCLFRFSDEAIAMMENEDRWLRRFVNQWKYNDSIAFINGPHYLSREWDLNHLVKYPSHLREGFIVSPAIQDGFLRGERAASLDQFVLIVRALIRTSGYIYSQKHARSGLSSFYNSSIDVEVFPFRIFWQKCVHGQLIKPENPLGAQIHSLYRRLDAYFRAIDNSAIYALIPNSNSIADELSYHFSFLILICWGIFDDFAWILRFLSEYPVNNEKLDLRKRESKKFFGKLESHFPDLYKVAALPGHQDLIKSVFEIRSLLIHRNFVHPVSVSTLGSTPSRTVLVANLDHKQTGKLRKPFQDHCFLLTDKDSAGKGVTVEPFPFIAQLHQKMTDLISEMSAALTDLYPSFPTKYRGNGA